ncbi:MAG: RecX family transcriptional regulator [Chlamydiales bacterium]|nr:RecX family transcriptional regulator [Chlamydiales bacterium]
MNIEIIDNKGFSELWVDGELWKEFHRRLYKNYLREILRCQSKKELRDLLLRVDVKIARGVVYKLLALKGYLKSELRAKLKRYKIAIEAIEKILDECEKLGYLDDQREGKLFIARQKRRGLGPQMIAYKLQQKAPELKEMVREKVTDEEQREIIKKWIEKKTKKDDVNDIKVKERLYRFLRGKGFDDHLIRQELFTP